MNLKLLTAAAVLSTAIVAPALAQDPAARAPSRQVQDQRAYHHRHYGGTGFWPGDVAAGVVGGAIGTAGAIATAPFRGSYAYNDPYGYNSGFVCQPGTMFIGADGRRRICQ
ncbi:hypothetical protein I6F35_12685 [Bradyrhizobium sp. BRP22]|uniref:hypothetical protein n=1 Tax=Bradyrhizobium sp. BRP22 TaxID=2793821 RepID=UPI001CD31E4E|nr:hypothetical protein [Bradyrhizobium sp. BRP22]MCA1454069.1 hypothetical protein [Bradyrhizobium sp. BRP22]